jgi:hypothetical protein
MTGTVNKPRNIADIVSEIAAVTVPDVIKHQAAELAEANDRLNHWFLRVAKRTETDEGLLEILEQEERIRFSCVEAWDRFCISAMNDADQEQLAKMFGRAIGDIQDLIRGGSGGRADDNP